MTKTNQLDLFETTAPNPNIETGICEQCGDSFPRPTKLDGTPRRNPARYCSAVCRTHAWDTRHRQTHPYKQTGTEICIVDGCDELRYRQSPGQMTKFGLCLYCVGHYHRVKNGLSLDTPLPKHIQRIIDGISHGWCHGCRSYKPLDMFLKLNARTGNPTGHCEDCHQADLERRRERYRSDPTDRRRFRKNQLAKDFGITPEDFDTMLFIQGCVCAICGNSEKPNANGAKYGDSQLAVDHDHNTGIVRGLLCSNCNTGIGLLGDDADRLLAAVAYLIQAQDVIEVHQLILGSA